MTARLHTYLATVLISSAVIAQTETRSAENDAPDMDHEKMMEMWSQLNAKGEQHAAFEDQVGTWKVVETHFMGPEPTAGEGSVTIRTILDGRYLVQEYKSEGPMGPFEGFSITGYDTLKNEYVMTWIDNMSTGVSVSHGEKTGNTITYTTRQDMPGMGTMDYRMTLQQVGPDKMTFTSSARMSADEPFHKQVEIAYTRVK